MNLQLGDSVARLQAFRQPASATVPPAGFRHRAAAVASGASGCHIYIREGCARVVSCRVVSCRVVSCVHMYMCTRTWPILELLDLNPVW